VARGVAPARIDLTSPDASMTEFGAIVSSAGDVNSDGLADFVVSGSARTSEGRRGDRASLSRHAESSTGAWNGAMPQQRIDPGRSRATSGYGEGP
jgi:hypothetical protein